MAVMHQDTSEDREVVMEKLKEIFEVSNHHKINLNRIHTSISQINFFFSRERMYTKNQITESTEMAREVVAEVCDIVAERGARLAAAGIVAMIKKLGRIENRRSVVTVEGALYEHYRIFRNYLHSGVWEMLGNDLSDNVIIQNPHGGAGTSALFLAASQTHRS